MSLRGQSNCWHDACQPVAGFSELATSQAQEIALSLGLGTILVATAGQTLFTSAVGRQTAGAIP